MKTPISSPKEQKKIFLECPDKVPGIQFGDPVQVQYERTVVTSSFFGDKLPKGSIVVQHNCWFRPVLTKVKTHLALARVAGYRNAIFGLPENSFPVLFEHPENPNILISSTQLSSYQKARFCPKKDWQIIIEKLQVWQNESPDANAVDWEMSVKPTYNLTQALPANKTETAFTRCAKWFQDHIFFRHAVGIGVFEGYDAQINPDGRQLPRPQTRGDCTGEASIIPALDWAIYQNYSARHTGIEILKNLFSSPELCDNIPNSPTYGGVCFYAHINAFYGDDNGRALMSAVLTSELTDNFDYVDNILHGMLMLLRSCGRFGFRRPRLDNPGSFLDGKTWVDYYQEDFVQYSPHRQAYLWACFLQAYILTDYQEFYDKAETAIRMTMDVFPDLEWTNGITQEYARLILPLAFLVEIKDTPEHRNWLNIVIEKLLENGTECGAIHEKMGDLQKGQYPAPSSNIKYGSTEAPLIQTNGDPVSDLLYTVNFAFIGLYEAAIATNSPYYQSEVSKMADFLCRIQARSIDHPYLDGCWLRGFDDELWEFFGSSADTGWGAWCVESGWTNNWIAGTMGLMQLNRGLLCRASAPKYKAKFTEIRHFMMDPTVKPEVRMQHITIKTPGAE
ncbi:MAG: hypothetical protein WCS73_11290 [Lentisphaeria bacterium]